jgi:hypothetical protein
MYCKKVLKTGASDGRVSHGLCRGCCEKHYPKEYKKILLKHGGKWPHHEEKKNE